MTNRYKLIGLTAAGTASQPFPFPLAYAWQFTAGGKLITTGGGYLTGISFQPRPDRPPAFGGFIFAPDEGEVAFTGARLTTTVPIGGEVTAPALVWSENDPRNPPLSALAVGPIEVLTIAERIADFGDPTLDGLAAA